MGPLARVLRYVPADKLLENQCSNFVKLLFNIGARPQLVKAPLARAVSATIGGAAYNKAQSVNGWLSYTGPHL